MYLQRMDGDWSLFTQSVIHDPQAVLHALLEIGVDVAVQEHEIPRDVVVDLDVRGDAAVLQARDFDDVEVCEEGDVVDARELGGHAALHAQLLVVCVFVVHVCLLQLDE